MGSLSQIFIFPVKSMRGHRTGHSLVETRGLKDDRRYMVVDTRGRMVTAREVPEMLGLVPHIEAGQLLIKDAKGEILNVEDSGEGRREVRIWKDTVSARALSSIADDWLSERLMRPVHLVQMDGSAKRPTDQKYSGPGDEVSFADGFPLLIANQASLDDLSARVGEAMVIERFRPNLLVDGFDAWAEDSWTSVTIGDVTFEVTNPCERCVLTTRDPVTAEKHAAMEPIKTLKALRETRGQKKVNFGVNAIARSFTTVRVGDAVSVG